MNILDPQGPIGAAEKTILIDSIAIMLAIVVPTIIAIFAFAYWFRASNTKAFYWPDWEYSGRIELVVWSIPALTVILLGGVAWIGSHQLHPAAPVGGCRCAAALRADLGKRDERILHSAIRHHDLHHERHGEPAAPARRQRGRLSGS